MRPPFAHLAVCVAALFACHAACPAQTRGASPPQPEQMFQRAMAEQQQGHLQAAASEYRALLRMQPRLLAAHANLGVVLTGLGQFDEAIRQYRAALALAPGNRALRLDLGLAYYKMQDFSRAAAQFGPLHQADPTNLRLAILLGDCDLHLGHAATAIPLLQPFAATHPDDLDLDWVLGQALIRAGHPHQGVRRVERVAEQRGSAEAYALAARTYIGLEDLDSARRSLDAAARLNPKLPGLHTLDGMIRSYEGDDAGAAQAFRAAVAANPDDAEAHLYLGTVLYAKHQFTEARIHLDRALRLEPDSSLARYERARVETAQGQTAAALADLEQAERTDPGWLKPHIELAALYFRIKRPRDGARERAIVDRLSAAQQQRKTTEGYLTEPALAP